MSLDQVAQRISQQEAELQVLRRDYQARTRRLDKLNRRRRQLQAQLDKIEDQIQGLNGARATAKAPQPILPAQPRKRAKSRAASKKKVGSLAQLLVTVLREAGRPLSTKELTDEVRRRGFPTSASDLSKLVGTRVWGLVKKGYLRRTKDHKIEAANGKKSSYRPQPSSSAAKAKSTQNIATQQTTTVTSKARQGQPSLAAVLTRILQKADKPLPGSELARRVLATGYQSQSKDFTNLIWVTLGRMDNVVNTKGQGYRLKKR